jgi:hypothetical protein
MNYPESLAWCVVHIPVEIVKIHWIASKRRPQ